MKSFPPGTGLQNEEAFSLVDGKEYKEEDLLMRVFC